MKKISLYEKAVAQEALNRRSAMVAFTLQIALREKDYNLATYVRKARKATGYAFEKSEILGTMDFLEASGRIHYSLKGNRIVSTGREAYKA